eukprot:525170-Pelagomonas_calceolata.AAC.4
MVLMDMRPLQLRSTKATMMLICSVHSTGGEKRIGLCPRQQSQRAFRKGLTVSAGTISESHQLEAQLGATKLMRIRRGVGHPSRLASCPPVSCPSSSLPHYYPAGWIS